ncbi:MAG TPA: thiosulfate oxidation carrier complex protein SoxZ [Gammaproteobacteria bacterium]|nr:thiosulfate oxidation carrier complex protein SoxZ [Gammaproteobacteria bacterium]
MSSEHKPNSIKIRATRGDDGITTVSMLIEHDMETGQRVKDKKTGEKYPAHFIQEVVCELNGQTVLTALWGPAVSKRPFMKFKLNNAKVGDTLKVSWVDNEGHKDSRESKVKPPKPKKK